MKIVSQNISESGIMGRKKRKVSIFCRVVPFLASATQNLAIVTSMNESFLRLATANLANSYYYHGFGKVNGIKGFFPNISACLVLVRREVKHLFVHLFTNCDSSLLNSRHVCN